MPKQLGSHNTSSTLRAFMVEQAEAGTTLPEIARFANVTLWTVQCVLKNHKEHGSTEDHPRSGRPSKVDDRTLRHLKIIVEADRRQTLSDITNLVNNMGTTHVSETTVQHILNSSLGLNARIAVKKPFLKHSHMRARLMWARAHRGWGSEDWQCIIWTDEASVEIGKDSRAIWVWRRPGERYADRCLAPTFKSGRQSLMIWGCMAYGRLGALVRIPKDQRTGSDYVRLVLGGPLWDFYSELYEARGMVAVMEDGAPIHRSMAAKDFHAAHCLEVLPHPAQSPDINPIEHVWKQLKTRINRREVRPKTLDELWVAIQEEWGKITVDFINKLVDGMPKHVEAVLKAKGGSTKY